MLLQYKEGAKTPDILQRVLKLTPADFDRAFNEYIKAKTSGWIEAIGSGPAQAPEVSLQQRKLLLALLKARPNDYFVNLRLGYIMKKEGRRAAIEHLKRATELFPFYTEQEIHICSW